MNPETKWNIFARELEKILAARGLRIGQLDNRHDDQGPLVHPQKVSRLQKSLAAPTNFTTLSPQELERVAQMFNFTPQEKDCLRAAVMATAVERILMDRIDDAETALMAANDVFRILLAAFANSQWLPMARKGAGMDDVEPDGDAAFEQALDLIDQGSLALHAYEQATGKATKMKHADVAHAAFEQALACLQLSTEPPHNTKQWCAWHDEAEQQMVYTATLLQKLKGE